MVRLAIGVLVVAAGCDLVFPPDDHQPPSYTLDLTTAFLGNEVDLRPTDVALGEAVYLVEDPAMPDGFARTTTTVRGPGRWYAEVDADGASVMFRVPEVGVVRIFQLPARALLGRTTVLRRADAIAGDDAALIDIDADFATPYFAGGLQTYVVGAWVVRDHVGGEIPPANSTDFVVPPQSYGGFTSVNQTTRWRITSADQAMILRFDTADVLVGALQVPAFDQGASTTLGGNISTVTLDRHAAFVLDEGTFARLGAVQPAVATPSRNWGVFASPGLPLAVVAGPTLSFHTMGMADPPAVSATYGNPFRWPDTLRISANAYRQVVPDGHTQTVPLYAGAISILAPTDVPPVIVDAPIPTRITLGATPLTADNVAAPIDRAHPVEITATIDRTEPGVFIAALYELVPGGPGGWTKVLRAEALAREPTWRVPAEIFDGGVPYFIRVLVYATGFPGIDSGDVRISPPVDVGYLDSGVFHVP